MRNGMVNIVDKNNEGVITHADGLRDIPHKMKFRVVLMTPKVASELLKHRHPRQRSPKEGRINLYKGDMECGFWQLTHQAVAVDEDGWLIDGQNRLEAIIKSGCTVPILLITGVPKTAMVALDQGMNRSVADVAKVKGREFRHGATAYAGVARAIMTGTSFKRGFTPQETLAFIDSHRKAIDFAFECLPKNIRFLTPAQVRAVLARAYYKRPVEETRQRLQEFGSVYSSGLVENPKRDSAAIRLRNWLTESLSRIRGTTGTRPKQNIIYGKVQQAVWHFLEGNEVKYLQETKQELFPIPNEPTEMDE